MNFILVLDGVTDVGNIGAIARTAYSLGVEGMIAADIKKYKQLWNYKNKCWSFT
jgi:tRNA G18 (ribose-2'-O)-methylase SpoU